MARILCTMLILFSGMVHAEEYIYQMVSTFKEKENSEKKVSALRYFKYVVVEATSSDGWLTVVTDLESGTLERKFLTSYDGTLTTIFYPANDLIEVIELNKRINRLTQGECSSGRRVLRMIAYDAQVCRRRDVDRSVFSPSGWLAVLETIQKDDQGNTMNMMSYFDPNNPNHVIRRDITLKDRSGKIILEQTLALVMRFQ